MGSPPTDRVMDVLELVARRGDHAVRAADVARELGIAKATAHAIIETLAERGWLVRTSDQRHLGLGPGLALVASAFDDQRVGSRLAIRAAAGLAVASRWPASVVELVGDTMFVSTVDPGQPAAVQARRVLFAAPFGTLFAAWGTPELRLAWFRRGRLTEAAIAAYGAHLDQARSDGFLVERMGPVLDHVEALTTAAEEGAFSEVVSRLAGELLDEVVRTAMGRPGVMTEHPVTSIAAPIVQADGNVTTALVLHPLTRLRRADIQRAAGMVRQSARAVESRLPSAPL